MKAGSIDVGSVAPCFQSNLLASGHECWAYFCDSDLLLMAITFCPGSGSKFTECQSSVFKVDLDGSRHRSMARGHAYLHQCCHCFSLFLVVPSTLAFLKSLAICCNRVPCPLGPYSLYMVPRSHSICRLAIVGTDWEGEALLPSLK